MRKNTNTTVATKKLKKNERIEKNTVIPGNDEKKSRPPIQNNRFMKIQELVNNGSFEANSNESFGALRFDLSKDPVQIKINDATGDYELFVPFESLKEFKLDVIVGKDKRCRPNVTVLLGDCQCYPELPEGTVSLIPGQSNDSMKNWIAPIIDELGAKNVARKSSIKEPLALDQSRANTMCEKPPTQNKSQNANNPTHYRRAHGGGDVNQEILRECVHVASKAGNDASGQKKKPAQKKAMAQSVQKFQEAQSVLKPKERDYSVYRNNLKGFLKVLMEEDRPNESELTKPRQTESTKSLGKGCQTIDKRLTDLVNQSTSTSEVKFVKENSPDDHSKVSKNEDPSCTKISVDKTVECKLLVQDVLLKLNQWEDSQAEAMVNIGNSKLPLTKSDSDDSSGNFETIKRADDEFEDASSNCAVEHGSADSLERFFVSLQDAEERREHSINLSLDRGECAEQTVLNMKYSSNKETCGKDSNQTRPNSSPIPSVDILWKSFLTACQPQSPLTNENGNYSSTADHHSEKIIYGVPSSFNSPLARFMAECIQKFNNTGRLSNSLDKGDTGSMLKTTKEAITLICNNPSIQQERSYVLTESKASPVQTRPLYYFPQDDRPRKPRIFFNAKVSFGK